MQRALDEICDWLGVMVTVESHAVRAAAAGLLALLFVLAVGNRAIGWLARRFREPIKSDSARLAQLHAHKQATPAMGGLLIIAGLLTGLFFFADLSNRSLQIAVLLCGGFAVIGAFDDCVKLFTERPGMTAKGKLLAQFVVSIVACVALAASDGESFDATGLGHWWLPLAVLVIVGSANGVNLTDGLDGLAAGCLAIAFFAMAVLCAMTGDVGWAELIGRPNVVVGGEMAVVSAAAGGAVLGFLRFNRQPAKVFMGDTGSLALGGLLGFVAVTAQLQMALVVIGIVFVAETLSVVVQVASYKLTGKRVFRCAPLHHHFQFLGWSERRTVTHFWFAGAAAALCLLGGVGVASVFNHSDALRLSANTVVDELAER